MILIKKTFLNLFTLLCLISCINCSHNVTGFHNKVKKPTGYLFANRDPLLMQGHTSSFVDGYMDGCKSGQNTAGDKLFEYTKDESRIAVEHDYAQGWEQGNTFCLEHMRDLIKHNQGYPDPYYSKEALEREKARIWSELRK